MLVEAGDGQVVETSRGGKLEIPVKVARREEFKENLKLVATGLPNEIKPGDITINADQSEGKVAMAITNNNAKPGLYTFFLRADTKWKHSRNPAAIKQAEADQKVLEEAVKQTAETVKQMTAKRDEANQQHQKLTEEMKQAEQVKTQAAAAVQQAEQLVKATAESLAKAEEALKADTANQGLADAVAGAKKAGDVAAAH